MPGRQSHGGNPSKKPRVRVDNKKRSINAFAIASQQHPEKAHIRQHRLGESEGGNKPRKRVRDEGDGTDRKGDSNPKRPRKNAVKGPFDELDSNVGSDSEGNEWRMGEVESDDSDLDSDEAFGDSDEEKFEGFAFSGSTAKGEQQKKNHDKKSRTVTLDEDDSGGDSQMSSGDENESLGDEAVDLAAMLDATEGADGKITNTSNNHNSNEGNTFSNEDSSAESIESDEESSISSIEDSDGNDPAKIEALQNLITKLPQAEISKTPSRQQNTFANEYNTPSDFGITSKAKLTLEDLGLPSIRDPFVKRSLKLLGSGSNGDKTRNSIPGKLEVPLAKRQQDRLDRRAAYDKSKETLDRWTDTIKHNRRAEHLIFPLPNADVSSAKSNVRLQPTISSKPFNHLEATIQNILEESGLAPADGKDDEDKLIEFEELEANKMSYEEVKARRDQLRMTRELLFREEARARRIKKIKSKSYRKVHRKQREKEDRLNHEALIEAGVEPSEDEQVLQDRRRAEERMGAKHRSSRWSKATRQTGRAAWDEDARDGLAEMARRDEDLRKRIDGKGARNIGVDDSKQSSSESHYGDSEDEGVQRQVLLKKLKDNRSLSAVADSGPGSKLSNMKFMMKAEESRKRENDETLDQIRRELAGEDILDDEEQEAGDVGRRIFRPGSMRDGEEQPPKAQTVSEFEERDEFSDDEDGVEIKTTRRDRNVTTAAPSRMNEKSSEIHPISPQPRNSLLNNSTTISERSEGGAWSRSGPRNDAASFSEARRKKQKFHSTTQAEELDLSSTIVLTKPALPKKSKPKDSTLYIDDSDENGSNADDTVRLPFAIKDQELIKRAFAGADVVGEFETEKRKTINDEDEKIIDNTLPGWGSWVGDGVSKRDKRHNKGRFLTKSEGIKEQNRKDAKLDRVIINEKRLKKSVKYLASNLPHPFETRQQYERSLRLPVGPEWTTKETFQDATKPRILIKQGIIAPMSKPLL